MAAVVDIYNMALFRIGNSQTVASVDESSAEARACNTFYEQCRDYMLRDFPWGFARRRVTLAQTTDAVPTNWQYVYAYPSDCLKFYGIVLPGSRQPIIPQQIPFELATNGTSRVIYCDASPAEAIYISKVEDPAQFDPLFVSALAYYLAAEICMPLSVKTDIQNAMRQAYLQTVMSAAASDMSETFRGPEPDGELIQIRNGSVLFPGSCPAWSAYPGGFFVG